MRGDPKRGGWSSLWESFRPGARAPKGGVAAALDTLEPRARPLAAHCCSLSTFLSATGRRPHARGQASLTTHGTARLARLGSIPQRIGQGGQGVRIALRIYFIRTRITIVIDYISNETGSTSYERSLIETSLRRGATAPHSRTSCTG